MIFLFCKGWVFDVKYPGGGGLRWSEGSKGLAMHPWSIQDLRHGLNSTSPRDAKRIRRINHVRLQVSQHIHVSSCERTLFLVLKKDLKGTHHFRGGPLRRHTQAWTLDPFVKGPAIFPSCGCNVTKTSVSHLSPTSPYC